MSRSIWCKELRHAIPNSCRSELELVIALRLTSELKGPVQPEAHYLLDSIPAPLRSAARLAGGPQSVSQPLGSREDDSHRVGGSCAWTMSAAAGSLVTLCGVAGPRSRSMRRRDLRLLAPPLRYSPFRASVGWMRSARRAGSGEETNAYH